MAVCDRDHPVNHLLDIDLPQIDAVGGVNTADLRNVVTLAVDVKGPAGWVSLDNVLPEGLANNVGPKQVGERLGGGGDPNPNVVHSVDLTERVGRELDAVLEHYGLLGVEDVLNLDLEVVAVEEDASVWVDKLYLKFLNLDNWIITNQVLTDSTSTPTPMIKHLIQLE